MNAKHMLAALLLVVVALDWVALHDILKGETDVRLEWTVVAASVVVVSLVAARILRRRERSGK